jgi:hypothetical protein
MQNHPDMSQLERVTLTLFLACMVVTAILFIVFLWTEPSSETAPKIMATFFVIGLANFLTWLPLILYRRLK